MGERRFNFIGQEFKIAGAYCVCEGRGSGLSSALGGGGGGNENCWK